MTIDVQNASPHEKLALGNSRILLDQWGQETYAKELGFSAGRVHVASLIYLVLRENQTLEMLYYRLVQRKTKYV